MLVACFNLDIIFFIVRYPGDRLTLLFASFGFFIHSGFTTACRLFPFSSFNLFGWGAQLLLTHLLWVLILGTCHS